MQTTTTHTYIYSKLIYTLYINYYTIDEHLVRHAPEMPASTARAVVASSRRKSSGRKSHNSDPYSNLDSEHVSDGVTHDNSDVTDHATYAEYAGRYVDTILSRTSATPSVQLTWLVLPPTDTSEEVGHNSDPHPISLAQVIEYNKLPYTFKQKETINNLIILLYDMYQPIILRIFLSKESMASFLGVPIIDMKTAVNKGFGFGFRIKACPGTLGQCK